MIEQIISFLSWINQCDDLPPECYAETSLCTCESFLVPFFLFGMVAVALFVLTMIRVFFGTIREPSREDIEE